MICELKIIEGPALGLAFSVREGEVISIGRHADADFCVAADRHISRKHVEIHWQEPHFGLRDLDSRNGTFINGTRIEAQQLRNGDRLEIGNSVFRILLEDETDTKNIGKTGDNSDNSNFAAPQRSLSIDSFPIGEETTHPFQMSAEQRADIFGEAESSSHPVADVSEQPDAPSAEPSNAEETPENPESEADDFWAQFAPSTNNLLWKQKAPASPKEAEHILDLLLAQELDCRLSLVVNRPQLATEGSDALLSFCKETALSDTLWLLQSEKPSDVISFYRRCLTKDAAVCLAMDGPISDVWLRTAISVLSFPSLLFGVVGKSRGKAVQLTQGSRFILFETSSNSELCMLRRS